MSNLYKESHFIKTCKKLNLTLPFKPNGPYGLEDLYMHHNMNITASHLISNMEQIQINRS